MLKIFGRDNIFHSFALNTSEFDNLFVMFALKLSRLKGLR